MMRLCYYSLLILLCAPLLLIDRLSLWEVMRLMLVVLGLGWFLWCRRDAVPPYIITLVYAFSFFHLAQVYTEYVLLLVLGNAIVATAFGAFLGAGLAFSPFSRLDKQVVICGGLVVLLQMTTMADPYRYGGISQYGVTILLVVDCLVLFFVVSRLLQVEQGCKFGRGLLFLSFLPMALVGLIGCSEIGVGLYYGQRALSSFDVRAHGESRRYLAKTAQSFSGREASSAVREYALGEMFERAGRAGDRAEAYALVGDLASWGQSWDLAVDAYKAALVSRPELVALSTGMANALFEKGDHRRAWGLYDAIGTDDAGNACSSGVALARMGRWAEANAMLDRAIEASGGALGQPDQPELKRGEAASGHLHRFVPGALQDCVSRLSLFEAVRLMQQREWAVLYPPGRIGAAGLLAPTDIVAYSGGGGSYGEERIIVGGEQVSPHTRGYNIVVLDASSGGIEERRNFDTWDKREEVANMGRFLNSVPKGKIVVATVNDEGSAALTGYARSALHRAGARRLPEEWWSHAFIGVVGDQAAPEAVGSGAVSIGVLAGNILSGVEPAGSLLQERADGAGGGIAVYLTGLDPESAIVIARGR
jgi:hypothetical protein